MTSKQRQIFLTKELMNLWTNEVHGIMLAPIIYDLCSKKCITSNLFVPKIIGQKNTVEHIQKSLAAFHNIRFKFNIDVLNNQILRVDYTASFIHVGMFFGFTASNRKVDVSGYTFLKFYDNRIINMDISCDIFTAMTKQGSIPVDFVNNNVSLQKNTNKNIVEEIKKYCNAGLTSKEIHVISLWLKGYSVQDSANNIQLSPRTIEDYRDKIKHKLKIVNKKYLYDYAKQNELLELFWAIM